MHLAKEYDLPFLGHLPFTMPMRERGDGIDSSLTEEQLSYIDKIAGASAQILALRNAQVEKKPSNTLPPIG